MGKQNLSTLAYAMSSLEITLNILSSITMVDLHVIRAFVMLFSILICGYKSIRSRHTLLTKLTVILLLMLRPFKQLLLTLMILKLRSSSILLFVTLQAYVVLDPSGIANVLIWRLMYMAFALLMFSKHFLLPIIIGTLFIAAMIFK